MMTDLVVPRSGYAAQRHRSPGALAAAIALNGGAFALLLAWPAAEYIIPGGGTLITRNIPIAAPPPPHDQPEAKQATQKPLRKTIAPDRKPEDKPFITDTVLPLENPNILDGTTGTGILPVDTGSGTTTRADPPPAVLVQARLDPRYAADFKPDYPTDMRRLGQEGSVTLHVLLNERGRVVGVDLVKASDPAFFEAARRHALRYWRFLPATRDGRPVGGELTLTLQFRLED